VLSGDAIGARRDGASAPIRTAPRLWHFAAEYLLALPVGASAAMVWVNLAPESYFRTVHAIAFGVNEVAMTLFFGWIAKEAVEAILPGGVLHSWRRAATPVAGAGGIVVVPALAYGASVRIFGEPLLQQAWLVSTAVDLAAGYFVARLIFGRGPAVAFFVLLAMSANAIGFGLLAVFDPLRTGQPAIAAGFLTAAFAAVVLLRANRVKPFWPYVLLGGTLCWFGLYFTGIHPAFALLPIVAFLPHARRDPGFFIDAPADAHDALNRLEAWCRHPAQAALLLFGLVNAGVPLRALESGVLSLPAAMLAGKPAGLLLGAGLALTAGLHLPRLVGWRDLVVLGFISAIGFTLALFFASATLGAGQMLAETKMGALLSLAGAAFAFAAAKLLRVGRFGSKD
jgi:NhaA family Na+:H+ antiporter